MYGIYANIKGVYWWDPCYHIYIYSIHGSYGLYKPYSSQFIKSWPCWMLQELGVQPPVGYWDPAGLAKDGDVETFKRRLLTGEIFMGFPWDWCGNVMWFLLEVVGFLCWTVVGILLDLNVFCDWIEGQWDGMEWNFIGFNGISCFFLKLNGIEWKL